MEHPTPGKDGKWATKWKWLGSGLIAGVVLAAVFAWSINYTDQRQFCASCHIMQEAARTQKMSAHANLTCNECHAPHALMAKIPFKVEAGATDIYNNIRGADLPIPPHRKYRDVVKQNCINCHAPVNTTVQSMNIKPYCTDCHRGVAHMPMNPISQRTVGYD